MKRFHVVLNQEEWKAFKMFLKGQNINFIPSGYGENVIIHFDVTSRQRELCEEFLAAL